MLHRSKKNACSWPGRMQQDLFGYVLYQWLLFDLERAGLWR